MPPDGKYALGLRGFPTPNLLPDDGGYLLFRLPSDNQWAGLILGAVWALAIEYNWYQWGDMLPEEAAEAFRLIIDQAPYNLIENGVPTPYWDDTSDVDDEETPETQTWYGIFDGTFQETVENFVIAGFLAYGGCIGCAIKFLTIAPAFRLAWKKGDLGGIIRIFIDGADAGTVDTYDTVESVLEADYVGDPEMEIHEILMYVESLP